MSQEKPSLIYIGDPLCSWCYGFSSQITAAKEELEDITDFKLIMGGLRPYNTETMADLGDFLKEHWDHVYQRSGMPFKYDILKDSSFVYDTEPPSRAVILMRFIKPELEFEFYKAIQKAFYAENMNTGEINTYLEILASMNVEAPSFEKLYNSDQIKTMVKNDFQTTANLGVRGFPTVILQVNGEKHLISNGYAESADIVKSVRKILKE